MFKILKDKTICVTRGDIANFEVFANLEEDKPYVFNKGDVVRFQVFEKKKCSSIQIKKDFGVEEEAEAVTIYLTSEDTRIGEIINKPVEYWYEIVVNPDTAPQTIVGYDDIGEKIFRLYPEGGVAE